MLFATCIFFGKKFAHLICWFTSKTSYVLSICAWLLAFALSPGVPGLWDLKCRFIACALLALLGFSSFRLGKLSKQVIPFICIMSRPGDGGGFLFQKQNDSALSGAMIIVLTTVETFLPS